MKNNTITIDGITYTFGLMPPTTGVILQTKLLKIVAPVMALFGKVKEEEKEDSTEIAVKAISKAFENLSESDIGYILNKLEDFTSVGVKRCTIDEDFQGKTLTLYKVIYGFLKYNFADFFALLPNDLGIKEKIVGKIQKSLKIQ